MNLVPLDDTKREAITPFLELAERVGITSGWFKLPSGWFCRVSGPQFHVVDATDYDYRSLCEAGAEWLGERYYFVHRHSLKWFVHTVGFVGEFAQEKLDCPDCKLAAITAAIEEVSK